MNARKEKFDNEIKRLSGYNESCFGYVTYKVFPLYFTEKIFGDFATEMKNKYQKAYQKYAACKGGELQPKNTRYGIVPPKMASVASSSRFIYLAFREKSVEKVRSIGNNIVENGEFEFEDELKINGIDEAKPNLDASFKGESAGIYIEAKCHELFDSHQARWKKKYFQNGVLFGSEKNGLGLANKDCVLDSEGLMKVFSETDENGKVSIFHELKREVFDLDEKEKLYFDIKQFVCHLLGIANDGLAEHELIYIYFKPNNLVGFTDEYTYLEKQFRQIAESKIISDYCGKHKISLKLVYSVADAMEYTPVFSCIYQKKCEA